MQLRHLQVQITGNYQGDHPLVTLPNLDKRTIHHTNRPCKPPLLEITKEVKQMHSTLARRTPRLQL
jgi:hypothetical protein